MTRLVLDASVAGKWFLPSAGEPLAPEAVELLALYQAGEASFLVPGIFWAELGNIFSKAVRQRRWSKASAESATLSLSELEMPTTSSRDLLPEAWPIALAYERSIYDCLYVALAVDSATELVTADERLANALAAHLPVKWLGAFRI